ncbi:very short patch repair endonuclease [Methylobacillus rhizosphaerae]|uniref:very short patch repair endonuclease n=1 Tax=Methylobacillus rhizosphaerae TaxID=551994 RepID=UPI000B79631D|nr:very short patch repair endonuclease [Methylobacillus rhizosphaerae]
MDNLTKEKRSKIMRSIKSKNTKPELLVRKLLTQLGYRYRLHKKDLPGKPDIVFPGRKKAIFIHGCFWHGHPNCLIAKIPDNEFWQKKIQNNIQRDEKQYQELILLGWRVLILWECELRDSKKLIEVLVSFINGEELKISSPSQNNIS